uniref:AAA-ATPase At2g46620-like n=1 Tax=Erigeron canadensis TaxID=72917 RepID=UPI001CB8C189|nr:AAA-ATPase At2g46620-like [Erigeron canadensis]
MFVMLVVSSVAVVACFWLISRVLSRTAIGHFLQNKLKDLEECFHAHQLYKIPKFNQNMQENQVYRKVLTYLNSLPSAENSDYVNLFSSNNKPHEINLMIDDAQQKTISDNYLGSQIYWKFETNSLVLKMRRKEKRRILSTYMQHIHNVTEEIEQKKKQIRLYINAENNPTNGRWISVPFSHPASIDTAMLDSDQKNKIKSDLDSFLKSEQYYHRLGRVWKRSYLLYGPSGTGKSSFIAAMAKFLRYDIYDVDLTKVVNDSDLKLLLLQTTSKSLIVVEDLDRYLADEKSSNVNLSGILNFMDGVISSCGEERVMVFTVSDKEKVDPSVLRPGRIDVHVKFPLCDFHSFKTLANSHLGLKEHKLFPQVEEIFQTGRASLSPAEVSEIMIFNRGSPTRAVKTVINALKSNTETKVTVTNSKKEEPLRLTHSISVGGALGVPSGLLGHGGSDGLPPRLMYSGSARTVDESHKSGLFRRESSVPSVKEFKRFYGLLKPKSNKKELVNFDGLEKENTRHEVSVF